jgi:hypothetical protein
MLSILRKILGNSNESEASSGELWIMIKENEFFRSDEHLSIVDDIAEVIESSGLGELDGHSSGAHQLEVNFYGVNNFNKSRLAVEVYLSKNHPKLVYTISNKYQTTYESP